MINIDLIKASLAYVINKIVRTKQQEIVKMSYVKIKCKCEFDGAEYNGVVVQNGVNLAVGDACDAQLGKVVSFDVPSPVLFVAGITSVSVGDGIPAGWLVLAAPAEAE